MFKLKGTKDPLQTAVRVDDELLFYYKVPFKEISSLDTRTKF